MASRRLTQCLSGAIFVTFALISDNVVRTDVNFNSKPTTIKTFENDSVLLPCYSTGRRMLVQSFFLRLFIFSWRKFFHIFVLMMKNMLPRCNHEKLNFRGSKRASRVFEMRRQWSGHGRVKIVCKVFRKSGREGKRAFPGWSGGKSFNVCAARFSENKTLPRCLCKYFCLPLSSALFPSKTYFPRAGIICSPRHSRGNSLGKCFRRKLFELMHENLNWRAFSTSECSCKRSEWNTIKS